MDQLYAPTTCGYNHHVLDTWMYDLIVIGGGPAGFFGALSCAEMRPGFRILILERTPNVLEKVRISGGGRCNVTHACFDPAQLVQYYPRGAKELRGAFARFHPQHTIAWFESRGVSLYTQADGCVFPTSDSSRSIIACLTDEAERRGVEVRLRCGAGTLTRDSAGVFHVATTSGETLAARAVLLASGGTRGGFALAAGLGHTIVPPVPSLFTFNLSDPRIDGLEGIVVTETHLALPEIKVEARGPLLVTHWGLSGPAVLRLSAWGARELHLRDYRMHLLINWLPQLSQETAVELLSAQRSSAGRKQVLSASPFQAIPLRLWKQLAAAAGVTGGHTWSTLPRGLVNRLAQELTRGEFNIQGKGQFKEEFVTCGGVALKEVDFRSMQSRVVPGLYLAGEVLDIDGLTGGYNLQNTWTTGWIAGRAIASQS